MAVALLAPAPCAAAGPVAPVPSPDPNPATSTEPSPGHRALGVGASVLPGVLLHGSGHFVLGQGRTAGRLLALEGLGLGLVLVGGGTLIGSGASRYLVGPAAAVGIMGFGMVATSLLADVIGVAWPIEARGAPQTQRPVVELELGHRAVHDPQFAYAHFLYQRLDIQRWGWRVSPSMWLALDDENARMRLEVAYRPWGPRSDVAAEDGSYIEIRSAVTHHRFAPERFRTITTELAARGRIDLWRLDRELVGQFTEAELGLAVQSFDFDVAGLATDHESLLLARVAHGVYVGHPRRPWAEVKVLYEHRHDTFAGGINGRLIGAPGSFGAEAKVYPLPYFGLRGEFAAGAALYGGVSLITYLFTPEDP